MAVGINYVISWVPHAHQEPVLSASDGKAGTTLFIAGVKDIQH